MSKAIVPQKGYTLNLAWAKEGEYGSLRRTYYVRQGEEFVAQIEVFAKNPERLGEWILEFFSGKTKPVTRVCLDGCTIKGDISRGVDIIECSCKADERVDQ